MPLVLSAAGREFRLLTVVTSDKLSFTIDHPICD